MPVDKFQENDRAGVSTGAGNRFCVAITSTVTDAMPFVYRAPETGNFFQTFFEPLIFSNSARPSYFSVSSSRPGGRKFSQVTTLLPVLSSRSRRALRAMPPPFFPASLFSFMPVAFMVSAIWRVESSARAVKILGQ